MPEKATLEQAADCIDFGVEMEVNVFIVSQEVYLMHLADSVFTAHCHDLCETFVKSYLSCQDAA